MTSWAPGGDKEPSSPSVVRGHSLVGMADDFRDLLRQTFERRNAVPAE
jgi:hypothetical protein